jgi:hypothetical protein
MGESWIAESGPLKLASSPNITSSARCAAAEVPEHQTFFFTHYYYIKPYSILMLFRYCKSLIIILTGLARFIVEGMQRQTSSWEYFSTGQ